DRRRPRWAASSLPRRVLHRQFDPRRSGGRPDQSLVCLKAIDTMRYLPLTDEDRREMLAKAGVSAIDDLFADVPPGKLLAAPPSLPNRKSEIEVERVLGRMAARNVAAGTVPFFVGCGAYR